MEDFKHFPNKYIDEIEKSDNYFIPVWEDVFSITIPPKELVDIGCGSGKFSIYLREKYNCKLMGIDGNKYALEGEKKTVF